MHKNIVHKSKLLVKKGKRTYYDSDSKEEENKRAKDTKPVKNVSFSPSGPRQQGLSVEQQDPSVASSLVSDPSSGLGEQGQGVASLPGQQKPGTSVASLNGTNEDPKSGTSAASSPGTEVVSELGTGVATLPQDDTDMNVAKDKTIKQLKIKVEKLT